MTAAAPQSTDVSENVQLSQHQWNVIMDILRLDVESQDAPERLGDVANQANDILEQLQRQLKRDGVETH